MGQTTKFCWPSTIVSPLIVHVVVFAVGSSVSGLYDVETLWSTFKNSVLLVSWTVLLMANHPELSSGPRMGAPSTKDMNFG